MCGSTSISVQNYSHQASGVDRSVSRRLGLILLPVILGYLAFGIWFASVPFVKPDDIWEIARAKYYAENLKQGEPLLPEVVSPYFAHMYDGIPLSQGFMWLKTSSMALFIRLLPNQEILALRMAMFCWSLILCLTTYGLARAMNFDKDVALLSVMWLIVAPEFFTQIHSSRTELMLTACYCIILSLFFRCQHLKGVKTTLLTAALGLLAWAPAILVHPSGLYIPATILILYLLLHRDSIFTLRTAILGGMVVLGAILYLAILLAPAQNAAMTGGGNFLVQQGPPILTRNLWHFVKTPLHFYQKLSEWSVLSKPVSLVWLLLAGFAFRKLFFHTGGASAMTGKTIVVVGLVPIAVLYLFSGSYGQFNVTLFPVASVVLGRYSASALLDNNMKSVSVRFQLVALSLLMLFSNFWCIPSMNSYARDFRDLQSELRDSIPNNASVVGTALYYLNFKNQQYASSSWLYENIGRSGQSFADGIRALGASHIIVDDHFLGMAIRGREKDWVDEMVVFLSTECTIIRTLSANLYLKGHVLAPVRYPETWRYPLMEVNRLRKIEIYRVTSAARQ